MPVQLEALAAVANLCAGEVRELRHSKKEGCVIENTMVRSGTPIRDTSCCYRPLTGVPYLRPGPCRTARLQPDGRELRAGVAASAGRLRDAAAAAHDRPSDRSVPGGKPRPHESRRLLLVCLLF